MSKVVKGVGRAIKSVVKGAKKLLSGAVKVVKKVFKSPFGRIALMAAGAYFGVPALTGLFGGGATGTVMGNLAAAWDGVTAAGSALMSGDFAGAGGALMKGAGLGGSSAAAGAAGGAQSFPVAAGSVAEHALGTAAPALQASGGGIVSKFLASSPYAAPALINAGSQLVGGVMQGYGAQQEQKHKEELAAQDRARYNTNVGTNLWGPAPSAPPTQAQMPLPDQQAQQQAIIQTILARAKALRTGG